MKLCFFFTINKILLIVTLKQNSNQAVKKLYDAFFFLKNRLKDLNSYNVFFFANVLWQNIEMLPKNITTRSVSRRLVANATSNYLQAELKV